MLREIKNVRQHAEEGYRRWFVNDFFDLIVWYNKGTVTGFQLCYDKTGNERSLTWNRDRGYSHNKIDDGEVTGHNKMTPILVADGLFDKNSIAEKFRSAGRGIDAELAAFIYNKLLAARGI